MKDEKIILKAVASTIKEKNNLYVSKIANIYGDIDTIVMDLQKKRRIPTYKEVQKEIRKQKIKIDTKHLKEYLKENFSITASNLPEWDNNDADFIRRAIAAEADAINLYENQAEKTTDERVKKALLHISKDEKEHLAELNIILKEIDSEQVEVEKDVQEGEHV